MKTLLSHILTAVINIEILDKSKVKLKPRPRNSSDRALCDFWLFEKLKITCAGKDLAIIVKPGSYFYSTIIIAAIFIVRYFQRYRIIFIAKRYSNIASHIYRQNISLRVEIILTRKYIASDTRKRYRNVSHYISQ